MVIVLQVISLARDISRLFDRQPGEEPEGSVAATHRNHPGGSFVCYDLQAPSAAMTATPAAPADAAHRQQQQQQQQQQTPVSVADEMIILCRNLLDLNHKVTCLALMAVDSGGTDDDGREAASGAAAAAAANDDDDLAAAASEQPGASTRASSLPELRLKLRPLQAAAREAPEAFSIRLRHGCCCCCSCCTPCIARPCSVQAASSIRLTPHDGQASTTYVMTVGRTYSQRCTCDACLAHGSLQ